MGEMIYFYHLGIKTPKNLTELCKVFSEKGINNLIELTKEGVLIHLIYNNNHIKFFVKLYEKEGDHNIYEMKFKNYEDFKLVHDMLMKK